MSQKVWFCLLWLRRPRKNLYLRHHEKFCFLLVEFHMKKGDFPSNAAHFRLAIIGAVFGTSFHHFVQKINRLIDTRGSSDFLQNRIAQAVFILLRTTNLSWHTGVSMEYTFPEILISWNFDPFNQFLAKIVKIIKIEGFQFPENCTIVLPHCVWLRWNRRKKDRNL